MVEEQFVIGGEMLCERMAVCLSHVLWHVLRITLPATLCAQEQSSLGCI